jgi:hypothetical protein
MVGGATHSCHLSTYDEPFLFVIFVVQDGWVGWERNDSTSCLFPYGAWELRKFVEAFPVQDPDVNNGPRNGMYDLFTGSMYR